MSGMGEFVRLEVEDGSRDDPAGPPADERAQRSRSRTSCGQPRTRGGGPRRRPRGRRLRRARRCSPPARTSRRWRRCPTPTWSTAPAALQAAFTAVARIPKPVVAAVTGYALGGGCELALCADFRVAGDNAKLGQPEILLGIIPGAGGTQRLPRLVGPSRAKDIIFTGRFVDADEALRIGLVDQVVAPDEVYRPRASWRPGSSSGAAYALRAAKEAIDRGLDADLDTGLEIERLQFAGLFATEDRDDRHAVVRRARPGQGGVRGALMTR